MTGERQDRSPYLRRLPIGERLQLGDVAKDPLFPFEGAVEVRAGPAAEDGRPER